MKYLAFISLIIIITSCGSTEKENKNTVINSSTVSNATTASNIIIDDPSLYPKAFLDSLKASNYAEPMHLGKNYIIVGTNTTYFPSDLKLNKSYAFTGEKDSVKYQLTIKQINLTDIDFKYIVSLSDRVLYTETGVSRLKPLFFLGVELPDDDITGEGYPAYEYFNLKETAMFSINLGMDRDENHLLRAFAKGENTKLFPDITLRSKDK